MRILGIETSHDDTSISIIDNGKVEGFVTYSQIKIHSNFGGVVPEIASREHVMNVAIVLEELRKQTNIENIDLVAYTNEPGLIGALHIGSLFAHGIAFALDVDIKPVNHLVGHIFSCAIDNYITYPALALIISGGHSQIMLVHSPTDIQIVGQTQDDAIGETYDKVARKLGLNYPGGPEIDKLAQNYIPKLKFTVPMINNNLNFSFSGLKSNVINYINKNKLKNINKQEVSAAFQISAITSIINKMKKAITIYNPSMIILGGGVSANSKIRKEFVKLHEKAIIPNLKYATDNGAMIAKAAELIYYHQ